MHYLDHAATTPVSRETAEVMVRVMTEEYGNPSAQYELGRRAKTLWRGLWGAVRSSLPSLRAARRGTTGLSAPRCIRTGGWGGISSPPLWSTALYCGV